MRKITLASLSHTLESDDSRYVMLTNGEGYSTDDGRAIDRRIARNLIPDLFETTEYRPNALVPSDDGLFPGMSQTWKARR